jgi:hypothetical protein
MTRSHTPKSRRFSFLKQKTPRAKASPRRRNQTGRIARRFLLERLEDRRVLAAVLFVDFGDNFPSGTLTTTQGAFRDVADDATPANRILGTTLVDGANGFNAGTQLDIVAQTFSATDRAEMMAVVRRAYLPLDIEVIELTATPQTTGDGRNVAAATSMADVINTLRAGPAGSKDAYIFVATFNVDPGGANPTTYTGGGGNSPGGPNGTTLDTTDLSAASNTHDDVAVVYSSGGFTNNVTDNIAHEAGHLLGLQHAITNNANAAEVNLFHRAEIMSYQNTGDTLSSLFTRYPMIRGDDNSPAMGTNPVNYDDLAARNGQVTLYDQLRLDANVLPNPNFSFISGTGAHDIITITKNGANVDVSVEAFADSAYTMPITVPSIGGTVYSYSFALSNSILVYAGGSDDRIVIDGDLGVDVQIDAMLGIDVLIVDGKGAASATYTPNSTVVFGADRVDSFGGTISIGGNSISFENFETAGSVTLLDFGNVNYATPLVGVDLLTLDRSPSGDPRVQGTVNDGTNVVPLLLQTVGGVAFQTGAATDTLTVNVANGIVTLPISYDGGSSVGDNDRLVITGNPGVSVARETYLVGATEDAGTWVVDPDGNMGGGAALAANGDELVIEFTNLEPVDSDVPVAVFDVILSTAADDASIVNGGLLNGFNSLQITDNGGTFETVRFARKDNVRIMGQSAADTIVADYTATASSLLNLSIYGHVGPGVGGLPADDNAADELGVFADAAGVFVTLLGQGGNDLFTVGDGDLTKILVPVSIDAGAGASDSLVVDDSGRVTGQEYNVDPTAISLVNGGVTTVVTFSGNLEFARLNGTQGSDTFHVTPSVDTEFFIDGNQPSTLPGDFLEINFAGTTGRTLTKVGGNGMWEFSNREDVKFEEIESFNYFPIIAIGTDLGATSRSAVQVYDAELNDPQVKFFAYGKAFKGGARVAIGDITADGIPEIITAPGPGRSPLVKVFDLLSGDEIKDFRIKAYESSFENGVYVATGDVTADGLTDIITSPGPGRNVHIRVWENEVDTSPADPFDTRQWLGYRAFGDSIQTGATVAAGDLNGDGRAEIVVGSGPGIAPRIRVYDIATIDPLPTPGYVSLLPFIYEIRPFKTTDRGGVFVAVGNVRGSSTPEIIAGSGVGGRGRVEMFNADGTRFKSFNAYAKTGNNPAVHVAVQNVDADAYGEVITGEGFGGTRRRRSFEADGSIVDDIFENDPDFRHGFFVA